MNTKTFFEFYDLNETEVAAILSKGDSLAIYLNTNMFMEFVANGFRTEFDLDFCHEFDFQGVRSDISLHYPITIKDYRYQDGVLSFYANDVFVQIPDTEVIPHNNRTA